MGSNLLEGLKRLEEEKKKASPAAKFSRTVEKKPLTKIDRTKPDMAHGGSLDRFEGVPVKDLGFAPGAAPLEEVMARYKQMGSADQSMSKEEYEQAAKELGIPAYADPSWPAHIRAQYDAMRPSDKILAKANYNRTAKINSARIMDEEENKKAMKIIEGMPGQQRQRAANDAFESQVADIEARPADTFNYQAAAAGINDLFGRNIDVKAMPQFRGQADKAALLAGLRDKIAGNYHQQAQNEAQFLNAMKLPPNVLTTGNVLGVQTAPTPKAAGKGVNIDKHLQEFTDRLKKDSLPALEEGLKAVDKMIPGGLHGYDGSDLPGYGVGIGTLSRWTGGQFNSDKGALRQTVAKVRAAVMRMEVGSQQTAGEKESVLEALGEGMLRSDADIVRGLQMADNLFKAEFNNRAVGAHPGVVDEYWRRKKQFEQAPNQAGAAVNSSPQKKQESAVDKAARLLK